MKTNTLKIIYALLAILFLASGVFGLLDLQNRVSWGYHLGEGANIIEIQENTSVEVAGLQVGDKIKSINGIDFGDTKTWAEQDRPVIGETRTFVVDRNGTEASIEVTFMPLSSEGKRHNYISFFTGLVCVLSGIALIMRFASLPAMLASFFLLLFGANSLPKPYIYNNTIERFVEVAGAAFVLFSLALLIDFLLHFPEKTTFRQRSISKWLIYLPVLIFASFMAWINIALPDMTGGLRTLFRGVLVATYGFYIVWVLVLLIQKFRHYTAAERSITGLSLLFIGLLIGFIPLLLSLLLLAFLPNVPLPFSTDLFPLAFIAVPIAIYLAIQKWEGQYSPRPIFTDLSNTTLSR